MDQADSLRNLMKEWKLEQERSKGPKASVPLLTVSSGAYGSGTSTVVMGLADMWCHQGKRVLVVDADIEWPYLSKRFLGELPRKRDSVVLRDNLHLLPMSKSLVSSEAPYSEVRRTLHEIAQSFHQTPSGAHPAYDIVVVDAGTIEETDQSFLSPNFHNLLVLTPELLELHRARTWIRQLRRMQGIRQIEVAVNKVTWGHEGRRTFKLVEQTANRFRDIKLSYCGYLPSDERIVKSIFRGENLIESYQGAPLVRCFETMIEQLKECGLEPISSSSHERHQPSSESSNKETTGLWKTLFGEVKK